MFWQVTFQIPINSLRDIRNVGKRSRRVTKSLMKIEVFILRSPMLYNLMKLLRAGSSEPEINAPLVSILHFPLQSIKCIQISRNVIFTLECKSYSFIRNQHK